MESLVRSLGDLGFSEGEARVYAFLLLEGPMAETAVSRRTGLRQANLDQILSQLQAKQAVRKSGPVYRGVPLEEFSSLRQEAINQAALASMTELEREQRASEQGAIRALRGADEVRKRALRMIEQATSVILMCAAPQELSFLAPALRFAEMRGVKVEVFCYGEPPAEYPEAVFHLSSDEILAAQGGRPLLLSVWPEGLSAVLNDSPDCGGIWGGNRYLANVIGLYVAHDLYSLRSWKFLPPETRQTLIRNLTDIPSRIVMAGMVDELPMYPYLPGILTPPVTTESAGDSADPDERLPEPSKP